MPSRRWQAAGAWKGPQATWCCAPCREAAGRLFSLAHHLPRSLQLYCNTGQALPGPSPHKAEPQLAAGDARRPARPVRATADARTAYSTQRRLGRRPAGASPVESSLVPARLPARSPAARSPGPAAQQGRPTQRRRHPAGRGGPPPTAGPRRSTACLSPRRRTRPLRSAASACLRARRTRTGCSGATAGRPRTSATAGAAAPPTAAAPAAARAPTRSAPPPSPRCAASSPR